MAGEEVPTITVRGAGGGEFVIDVPAVGTAQRELLDDALASGRLTIVEGALSGPTGDDSAPAVVGELPAKNGTQEEWAAYAVSKGADPEEAAAASRSDLIDAYGSDV